ncbi:hypothetical protein FRZ61_19560 [Hypericibacter adhaerens]|uniref:Uncharacterized protein n=1 Tax=Hypericibacter adhaerens TaxID=2602016 RepID=A0A5J6MY17_9PROT|nr:hypothetical protein FRZ61_19560 [Hypericibacter adhaerens]
MAASPVPSGATRSNPQAVWVHFMPPDESSARRLPQPGVELPIIRNYRPLSFRKADAGSDDGPVMTAMQSWALCPILHHGGKPGASLHIVVSAREGWEGSGRIASCQSPATNSDQVPSELIDSRQPT